MTEQDKEVDTNPPREYHGRMEDNHSQFDTIDLAYAEAGAGEPLVFIHGLGGSRADWELQVPSLAPPYRVITPDLRGHGLSPKPAGPYRIELFAADVAMLLRRIVARPAHVVGLSLGGAVAQQLALDAPDLVRSLVLVNTAARFMSAGWRKRLMGVRRFAATYLGGMQAVAEDVAQQLFPRLEQAALRSEAVQRLTANDPRTYRDSLMAVARFDSTDRLSSIACPTLVISGDQDYAVPMAAKRHLAEQIPNSKLVVIPHSGHATPADQPEAFNEALLTFLREAS
ncbi:MAG: alpha/beta fold hydrolase [Anaerolineae bacterium]|nr:alpha/beta fold hydrolase [Anaerolineae bacterium]